MQSLVLLLQREPSAPCQVVAWVLRAVVLQAVVLQVVVLQVVLPLLEVLVAEEVLPPR